MPAEVVTDEELNLRNKTWIELVFARREYNYLANVLRTSIPKKVYGRRINGKKKVIAHPGSRMLSKWMRYSLMLMQKGQELERKEVEFADLLNKKEKAKKGSLKEAMANANSNRRGASVPQGS